MLEEGHYLVAGGLEEAKPLVHSSDDSWRQAVWPEVSRHLLVDSVVVHFYESRNGDQILSEMVNHF